MRASSLFGRVIEVNSGDWKSCTTPAKARVFTRVVNDERQMYGGAVFYLEEDANVARFINSFTIGSPQKIKSPRR